MGNLSVRYLVAKLVVGVLITWGAMPIFVWAEQISSNLQKNYKPGQISIQCGNHTIAITCGKKFDPDYPEDKRQCNHNTLIFIDARGKEFVPPAPKNFDESKTPASLRCSRSDMTHQYFVIVEFRNGPSGCLSCMTFNLFQENGKRLTAEPTDNNKLLAKMSNKLKLQDAGPWVEIEPVQY